LVNNNSMDSKFIYLNVENVIMKMLLKINENEVCVHVICISELY